MSSSEDAAMSYNPDDDRSGAGGIQVALTEAEQQLTQRKGVKGMGMAKTPSGEDAIVVYVADEQTLSQLPANVGGFPVVGEITGEIKAL